MGKLPIVLPNFLIPGAGKSGTSFVASMLGTHPDVFIPLIKEPSFFSTYPGEGFYLKGMPYYQKYFVGYRGEIRIGEASTVYMFDPASPALIRENLGLIKLIFILRNPIARAYSNYWQDIKGGHKLPGFHFFITSGCDRSKEMVYVSRYDLHLKRYLHFFSREDILIITYDQLKSNPRAVFDSITDFLHIKTFDSSVDLGREVNPAAVPRSKVLARIMRNRHRLALIKDTLPGWAISPVKKVADVIKEINTKKIVYKPMKVASWEFLYSLLKPTIDYLECEMGLSLNHWRHYRP
jgi:hypothetical protein